jgi:hypothetical protein
MTRRFFLFCLALLGTRQLAVAESTPTRSGELSKSADFKERLEKDLMARRPSEFAFIDKVVGLVDAGTLPRSLVNAVYLWARRQARPFQYFERGLRVRAAKIGVTI